MNPLGETVEEIRKRLASVARAMLVGEMDLLEGCRELARLSRGLPEPESSDPDLLTFVGVDSELDDIPFGAVRGWWATEALAEKDRQRDKYLAEARHSIEQACRMVVEKYS